ncbi:MAG: DUF2171 domain-containing protein [Actinomycetota bacterium]
MTTEPISYLALPKGARIVSSDGEEVGRVSEVISDDEKDIFSGITFRHGVRGQEHFIPAELVTRMTAEEVTLGVTSAVAMEKIEPYED